jgi:predicted MFS family arabinose efflux permease
LGLTLTVDGSPGLGKLLGAAVALGASFGVAQALTIAALLEQLRTAQVGAANAVWNAAYDLGYAVGAVAVGTVINHLDYSGGAFAAVVLAVVAIVATVRPTVGQKP